MPIIHVSVMYPYMKKPPPPMGEGAGFFTFLVGVRGFEPPTAPSRTEYSTKLSYTPKC